MPAPFPAPVSPDLLRSFLPDDHTKTEPIAVAVSGGPDSMALCRLLSQWAAEHDGPPIHALTVDHGLRPESHAEAAQVGIWIKDWPHVRHAVLDRDLTGLGKTRILEQARNDRYALLTGYCRTHDITRLFVAHHLDDQAETVLFRLSKSSGLDGLCGMRAVKPYDGEVMIIRPFLPVLKDDLVSFCKAEAVPFLKDPSNDDDSFARVRLRRSAAILTEEGLTPARLGKTAARLSRAQEALDYYTVEALKNSAKLIDPDRIVFDFRPLAREPEEIRLRVLLRAMEMIAAACGIDRGYGPRLEKMEALTARLFMDQAFSGETLGGFVFSIEEKTGAITVRRENP